MNQIYPQAWIHLAKEVRLRLVEIFDLPRTGVTEIKDQEILSDGHTVNDLKGITLEKMTAYIGSEETFARAWELTLTKIHSELHPPLGELTAEGIKPMPEAVIAPQAESVLEDLKEKFDNLTPDSEEKPKRGRPSKQDANL